MPDIKYINSSRDTLTQLLDMRRELRREMITFILSLSDIWKHIPPEVPTQSKINLLKESINIFFEELNYSSSLLDQQNSAVMQTLAKDNEVLKDKLRSLDELSMKVTQFEKQQKLIHNILEDLEAISPHQNDREVADTVEHDDSDITKLKQHIFLLQNSSRQLSDLVDRLKVLAEDARRKGFIRNAYIKLKELENAVESVTQITI